MNPHEAIQAAGAWVAQRPWLVAAAIGAVGLYAVGINVVANLRHNHHANGARLVLIAAPPEVDPTGAVAWWTNLLGVLTPSTWRGRLWGAPHVGMEYRWQGWRLQIAVWVPGTVPPGAVEAAARAAWPGAAAAEVPATPPVPLTVAMAGGGALVPALTDTLPLDIEPQPDPLRPLVSAGAEVRDDEYACVQILARPATARRVRRARGPAPGKEARSPPPP